MKTKKAIAAPRAKTFEQRRREEDKSATVATVDQLTPSMRQTIRNYWGAENAKHVRIAADGKVHRTAGYVSDWEIVTLAHNGWRVLRRRGLELRQYADQLAQISRRQHAKRATG